MTINGIIARKNGEEDFLSHENWNTFVSLAKKYNCFIVGRKTYDVVKNWPDYNFDDIKGINKIIVSKNKNLKLDKNYILANSPENAVIKAKSAGIKTILITGGSRTNSAFMKVGLIDEIILNIEPVVLGNGIKIFAEEDFESQLKFIKTKHLSNGIIQLYYKIKK